MTTSIPSYGAQSEQTSPPNVVPIRVEFLPESGFDAPAFQVVSASLDMGLSLHFELTLVVQVADAALHLGALLRRRVVVLLDGEPFIKEIHGIVRRARARSTERSGMSRYEIRIVPPLFLLHRCRNHRIFTMQSSVEILQILLSEHGSDVPVVSRLKREARRREYTVQYGETNLHFIKRLLADDGIVLAFDLALPGSPIVLMDDTAEQAFTLDRRLPFVDPTQLIVATPAVYKVVPTVETTWAGAVIRDYDDKHPLLEISGVERAPGLPRDVDLEYYEFDVGEVTTADDAKSRAADTLDAKSNRDRWVKALGTALAAPGTKIFIDGCVRPETEHELLVAWSYSSWWSEPETGNVRQCHELICIAGRNRFKTPRLEKPRVPGVQTGLVVGGPGMEIDVDKNGEVEVEFKWDRQARHVAGYNRRVRVSQGWAGPGYGLVTFPRVGDEVVVAYLDGDPDEPLVVGRVHNPTRPNPIKTPEDQTVSIWRSKSSPGGDGYNEILMDDLAGKERLEMHAQLDFSQVVERDAGVVIRRDYNMTVHGDRQTRVVGKGDISYADGFSFVTNKNGYISAASGSLAVRAKDMILYAETLAIDSGPRKDNVTGSFVTEVVGYTDHNDTGNYNHTANAAYFHVGDVFKVDGPYFQVEAGAGIRLTCGGSMIELTPSSITIQSSGPVIVNGAPIKLNC